MKLQKHICFFSGKRGGFNHFVPLLEKIDQTDSLRYSLIIADMHLSEKFGNTFNEVERWANHIFKLNTLPDSDSKLDRALSIGRTIQECSRVLSEINPDLAFALGDRGEVLGFAIAALELNIPIIHLFGGDVCQGGVDEPVRHAITKLASIHLASNDQSAKRILRMGEEPWRVYNVGSPVLDLISRKRFSPPEVIKEKFNLDLGKPVLLLLQHSVTWQVEQAEHQMQQTMEAIDNFGHQTIAVYPCSDPGYEDIIRVLTEYQHKSYVQIYKNVEFQDFWGLLNVADVLLGNSSTGVMEAASFKIPFINIGIRQEGRLRADNTIDVDHDKDQIIAAINTVLHDEQFKRRAKGCVSPYGDGKTSGRIIDILRNLQDNDKLIKKKMTY